MTQHVEVMVTKLFGDPNINDRVTMWNAAGWRIVSHTVIPASSAGYILTFVLESK